MRPSLLVIPLMCSACSSIDVDVVPRVERARITIDRSAPDALAETELELTFDTEVGIDRVVVLDEVGLIAEENAPLLPLALAFPVDFDGRVRHGDTRTIRLVDEGVKNSTLAATCGRQPHVFVKIRFLDEDPNSDTYAANAYPERAIVSCP